MVFLGRTKKIHFVGVGGIGMSGIAELLLNFGFKVTGSDLKLSDTTERLGDLGADVRQGHHGGNVEGADVVVYSSAVDESNPEIAAAMALDIPVISSDLFSKRRTELPEQHQEITESIQTGTGSHQRKTTMTG